jgi:hypothetical protein
MLRAINEDHDENEGPMHGSTILDMKGLPDETNLAMWMEKAGMTKSFEAAFEGNNDQLFDCDDEEEE